MFFGIDQIIGSGHATALRFNRKGSYLASGRVSRFSSPHLKI